MGEARRRGTYEERRRAALAVKAEQAEVHRAGRVERERMYVVTVPHQGKHVSVIGKLSLVAALLSTPLPDPFGDQSPPTKGGSGERD
jgi:hypothetical protein